MRYVPRAILAGGLGFAASFVAACGGGSGLLSGDQSIALNGQADQISQALQSGDCAAAFNASDSLNGEVQTLPVTVNPTLRRNLSQGASTIAELARRSCRQRTSTTASTPTSTSSSTTSTSTSTPTSTSTTTTTPTTSTSTTTTTSTTATTPTGSGTTSTTGGVGLGGGTTTTTGNGSGGAGPGAPNTSGTGGGG